MRLILRWLITAVALVAAARLVPGIEIRDQSGWFAVLVMAAVLGFANAIIRPILKLLSCPLILLTLGLFTLVVNAVVLYLSASISNNLFGAGFFIDGFWPAFWGSIVVSIISALLSIFLPDDDEQRRR